jgi:hypothetical protein
MFAIGDKVKYISGGLIFIGIVKEKLGNIYNINVIDVKISPNYLRSLVLSYIYALL